MNEVTNGMPVFDSEGNSIGRANRVHPDYFFVGDEEVRSFLIRSSWVERVGGTGTIFLNLSLEEIRSLDVNLNRLAASPQLDEVGS